MQAEAIADMINATSIRALQAASRSLQGDFSQKFQQYNNKYDKQQHRCEHDC